MIGVGFTGVVSGDGISSILKISSDYCSPSSNCTYDLVLTLDYLVLWLASSFIGGAMAVNVEHLLNLNCLCDLCKLHSMILSLYRSLSVLFSQIDSFLPLCVLYGHPMKIVKGASLIMGSMHLQLFCTFHYSSLMSLVGMINVASHRSFNSS
jgi:hypothetical protein